MSDSESPSEIIEKMQKIEKQEVEDLLQMLQPMSGISTFIDRSTNMQEVINEQSVAILENSKRLHDLMQSNFDSSMQRNNFSVE